MAEADGRAEEYVEAEKARVEGEVAEVEAELGAIADRMGELKRALYGRFGKAIHLENAEDDE